MNRVQISDIADSIRKVLRKDDVAIDRDTELADLGLESLDMVELMFFIEDKFGIEIPYNANDNDGALQLTTVGSIADAVQALLTASEPAAA